MPESQPESNPSGAKSFWSTLPGVLTAVGGIIAGTAALLTALVSAGVLGDKPTATPVPVVDRDGGSAHGHGVAPGAHGSDRRHHTPGDRDILGQRSRLRQPRRWLPVTC